MMGGCRGFYDGGNILNFDLDSNCILQNVPFLINQTDILVLVTLLHTG
jgi:hypothetical protein